MSDGRSPVPEPDEAWEVPVVARSTFVDALVPQVAPPGASRRSGFDLATDGRPVRPSLFVAKGSILTGCASSRPQDLMDAEGLRNTNAKASWTDIAPVPARWRGSPADREAIYSLLLSVQLDDGVPLPVDIVFMNGGHHRHRNMSAESRSLLDPPGTFVDPDRLTIANLMQGVEPSDGSVYPGDRGFRSDDAVTVQVHSLTTHTLDGQEIRGEALAIHLPTPFRDRLIRQVGT